MQVCVVRFDHRVHGRFEVDKVALFRRVRARDVASVNDQNECVNARFVVVVVAAIVGLETIMRFEIGARIGDSGRLVSVVGNSTSR